MNTTNYTLLLQINKNLSRIADALEESNEMINDFRGKRND